MNLVTDAIARLGINDPVFGGYTLKVLMVIRIFEPNLNGVVIHITDRKFIPDAIQPHCFKLKIRHRSRGILGQGLIDPDRNFPAGRQFTTDQMFP
jgi:hypothetical protein